MQNKNRNKIIPQMYDVRPVNAMGDLDLKKIKKTGKILQLEKTFRNAKKKKPFAVDKQLFMGDVRKNNDYQQIVRTSQEEFRGNQPTRIYQFGKTFQSDSVPVVRVASPNVKMEKVTSSSFKQKIITPVTREKKLVASEIDWDQTVSEISIKHPEFENVAKVDLEFSQKHETDDQIDRNDFFKEGCEKKDQDNFSLRRIFAVTNYNQFAFSFSGVATVVFIIIFGIGFFNKGLKIKDTVLGTGKSAYADLAMAGEEIKSNNFEKSRFEFNEAYDKFTQISEDIDSLGSVLVKSAHFIPYLSKISSGYYISQSGKDIARIGVLGGEIMQLADEIKNPLDQNGESVSFLKIFQDTDNNLKEILVLLQDLQDNLDKVAVDDIPDEQRAQFVELKSKLPEINQVITGFLANSKIFTDVLGGNGPRKYLFLFQNNQEMRATGGFIGTYGLMDISNGNIRKFFIDGIFNPDGQLQAKVIPPTPIQKISAAWSLHDSNWFPDFPKSAEKASWFFEKTGGPTVDGVITMTPNVMQKLLEVTGPIEMPEYDVIVDKDNFIEKIQYEVEVDYDKELNHPKQILADLAPKILDKIFTTKNLSDMAKTMDVLVQSLNEKQILIYSKNYEIEKILSQAGWSGEILNTQKDYLSVINTNINGYKTDGVVSEKISHKAEIQSDGSIIDTVTVTRHHNGGNLDKEWWNKVNADYMRIYVPKGSVLISATGQTREFNAPPLNYDVLGFKHDVQVQTEEDSIIVDEESGTRIYKDSNKTVFANWVYVSPQETVEVTYEYLLPFKIFSNMSPDQADSYSLLAQKQSGSVGDEFVSEIFYPENYKTIWSYPEEVTKFDNGIRAELTLETDRFVGTAFVKE